MKALKDLEKQQKAAAKVVEPENKLVVASKVEKEEKIASPTDPEIMKAAEAAAAAIVENEKKMD